MTQGKSKVSGLQKMEFCKKESSLFLGSQRVGMSLRELAMRLEMSPPGVGFSTG